MRILQLCNRVPYPPVSGGNIASYNLAKGLAQLDCSVHLLCYNTSKHPASKATLERLNESFYESFHSVNLDNHLTNLGALKNLLGNQPFHISRYQNAEFADALIKSVNDLKPDVIIMEGLNMTAYIALMRENTNAKLVLRAHNIESEIWIRQAEAESNLLRKEYLKLQAQRLAKYEKNVANQVDGILPITQRDAQQFQNAFKTDAQLHVTPAALDFDEYQVPEKTDPTNVAIGFLGTLDWLPNTTGLSWFLKEVGPHLDKGVSIEIAGSGAKEDFIKSIKTPARYVGRLDDAKNYLQKLDVLIVPLLSGGGMRIKILEAMALNTAVVTTSIGIEGIEAKNEQHALIQDSPKAFAASINKLVEDDELRNRLIKNGNEMIMEKYNLNTITTDLYSFLKAL